MILDRILDIPKKIKAFKWYYWTCWDKNINKLSGNSVLMLKCLRIIMVWLCKKTSISLRDICWHTYRWSLWYLQFTFRWLSTTEKADTGVNEGSMYPQKQEQHNTSVAKWLYWWIMVKHTGVFILLFFQLFCRFEIIKKKSWSGGRKQRYTKSSVVPQQTNHTAELSGAYPGEHSGGWGAT